jgi:GrpB-like predicted nucleotidyltransferase (UPF0157 family)/mannose-6-phosphate isomerase-like protein (cupin superfamily)/GNAT superfamily N-acetyltransferase
VSRSTGERIVFLQTAKDTDGALLEMDDFWPRADHQTPEHLHPAMEERWEVIAGTVRFAIDGVPRTVETGDAIVAPPGSPHSARNVGRGPGVAALGLTARSRPKRGSSISAPCPSRFTHQPRTCSSCCPPTSTPAHSRCADPRTLWRIETVTIRHARDEDVWGIAEIHVRSWQAAYRGILPDVLLDGLSVSERESRWRSLLAADDGLWLTLVAERDGDLAGFCSVATPSRDVGTTKRTAEIGALHVDPRQWRQGAGGALLKAAFAELSERCFREATLWVLPANQAALAFYEQFGFEVEEGVEKHEERSGRSVVLLRRSLDEPIRIVAYEPEWPIGFEQERVKLEEAIGEWIVGGFHHVGSTAVPCMEAKPIIDILAGVRSLEESRACFEPLVRLGYVYAPYQLEEMHWFCKPHPSRRTHHLHLVPVDSGRYRDELAFRDRLRADPGIAAEYVALKRELARRFAHDREVYTEAKSDFIRRVLDRGP